MSGRRVFGVDMSVLRFQDQPGKSKPDSGAVFRCVFSAVESVKQMGKILFGEAAAAILYKNLSIDRVPVSYTHLDVYKRQMKEGREVAQGTLAELRSYIRQDTLLIHFSTCLLYTSRCV